MKDSDRQECVPVLLSIERAGGPSEDLGADLRGQAMQLRLVNATGYTLKANRLRRELLAELAPATDCPTVGDVVDATLAGHTVRCRVAGMFNSTVVRLRHWTGARWQTFGVHRDDLRKVSRQHDF